MPVATQDQALQQLTVDEQRHLINSLSVEEQKTFFSELPVDTASKVIGELAPSQVLELLKVLPNELTADLIVTLPASEAGDMLRDLPESQSEGILAKVEDQSKANILQEHRDYKEGCAGALMQWYALSFSEDLTVKDLLTELKTLQKQYSDEDLQYFFTTNHEGKLKGVVSSRSILFASDTDRLSVLMTSSPFCVIDTMSLTDLHGVVLEKSYLSFPVVDADGKFLGVVSRQSILTAFTESEAEQFLKSKGIVGGEELRSMPLLSRCAKRLSWLTPNIALNMLSAVVIALFQETLEQVILLAVFLPVVSNMSGCSGSQSIAVSIRELTLGVMTPHDTKIILQKELFLGLLSGSILGSILGIIAGIWGQNMTLGLVIGLSLFLNTIVSVLLGGCLPLLLKRLKIDPALASSPILTTCTDLCGFLFVLGFATLTISSL